jgi:hypothetical protein
LDAANPKSYPGSGTTWSDLSGNGNNGTLTNGPTFDSGNGGSLSFDGASTSVSTNLTRDNNAFSYSAWFVYLGGTGEKNIICTFETTSQEWTRLNVFNGNHSFHIDNDGNKTLLSGSSAQIGSWYNSVGVWDPNIGSMKLYINGVLNAQTTKAQTSTILGLSNLFIGKRSSGGAEYFNGYISFIQVYNRALTQQEILQNYNATKGRYGL